jgi:hypothetical protein
MLPFLNGMSVHPPIPTFPADDTLKSTVRYPLITLKKGQVYLFELLLILFDIIEVPIHTLVLSDLIYLEHGPLLQMLLGAGYYPNINNLQYICANNISNETQTLIMTKYLGERLPIESFGTTGNVVDINYYGEENMSEEIYAWNNNIIRGPGSAFIKTFYTPIQTEYDTVDIMIKYPNLKTLHLSDIYLAPQKSENTDYFAKDIINIELLESYLKRGIVIFVYAYGNQNYPIDRPHLHNLSLKYPTHLFLPSPNEFYPYPLTSTSNHTPNISPLQPYLEPVD